MVVPTEKLSSGKTKKIVGNNQTINLEGCTSSNIKVIGNNCSVNVSRNEESIKVIGDSCVVCVKIGSGSISYVGNNGLVKIGEDVSLSRVQCIGSNCKVMKMSQGKYEEVKLPKAKVAKSNSVGSLNINNRNSIHIGHCEKICIPYFEISLSVPCLKTKKN